MTAVHFIGWSQQNRLQRGGIPIESSVQHIISHLFDLGLVHLPSGLGGDQSLLSEPVSELLTSSFIGGMGSRICHTLNSLSSHRRQQEGEFEHAVGTAVVCYPVAISSSTAACRLSR